MKECDHTDKALLERCPVCNRHDPLLEPEIRRAKGLKCSSQRSLISAAAVVYSREAEVVALRIAKRSQLCSATVTKAI